MLGALVLATWGWSRPFIVDESEATGSVVALANAVFLGAFFAFPVVLIASFVSSLLRFRGSAGDERLQLKWFATAAAFVAVSFALQFTPVGATLALSLATTASLLFLYWAVAVAVLKYRLYEIDVVIGRTVVFALLAGFITVVYVGVVVGVGTLVGTSRSPFLSAAAAALVAVAFQPVRQRARRVANRVVYGKRATPYEVLSGFTERAAETYSTDDVLPRLVRVLGEGSTRVRSAFGCASGRSFARRPIGRMTERLSPVRSRSPTASCRRSRTARWRSRCATAGSCSAPSVWSRGRGNRSVRTGNGSSPTLPPRPGWCCGTCG